jgi:hypothetical protein
VRLTDGRMPPSAAFQLHSIVTQVDVACDWSTYDTSRLTPSGQFIRTACSSPSSCRCVTSSLKTLESQKRLPE